MGFKMKKDLWGLYNSAESATRQGNSSATPITKKASPLQMNATLVEGAGMVGMSAGFNDVSPQFSAFYSEAREEPKAEDLNEEGTEEGAGKEKESEENTEV